MSGRLLRADLLLIVGVVGTGMLVRWIGHWLFAG